MALYNRTTAKVHLQIPSSDTTLDTFLDQVGPQCETALLNKLKIQVEEATITRYYSGNGTNKLWLEPTPVRSITSIYTRSDLYSEDGDAEAAADLLTAGTDYTLVTDQPLVSNGIRSKSGLVMRLGNVWSRPSGEITDLLAAAPGHGMGNIKVVHVAGWHSSLLPGDFTLALYQYLAVMRSIAVDGGMFQSESLDYWSGTRFSPDDFQKGLGSVLDLIKPYKKIVI